MTPAFANTTMPACVDSDAVGRKWGRKKDCNFPTDSWKISDRERTNAQSFSFPLIFFPKIEDFQLQILHF